MKRASRAFVLLELIVALTILGLAVSVLFSSMSGSTRNIGRLEALERRQRLFQNLLAELDLVESVKAGDRADGTLEDGTRWRIEVEPFVQNLRDSSGVVRILIRLEWGGTAGTQVRTIETYRLARTRTTAARSLEEELRVLR